MQRVLHAVASLSLFISLYLGTFAIASLAGRTQWAWLVAGCVATFATITIAERGSWRIGLAARPAIALRELALGAVFAIILVLFADALILASTPLRHARGNGFPWRELFLVYLPAAFHEEIVFRGYPLQKLRTIDTRLAVVLTSFIFAAMHARNHGITMLALINLLLAGVMLALAYLVYERLWFPIGLHLAWNNFSGPILGYDISGYIPAESVLALRGNGRSWLTGGFFGIEGSVWMVVVQVVGITVLLLNAQRNATALRRTQ